MTTTDITQADHRPTWAPRPTATCGATSPATARASRRRSSPAARASRIWDDKGKSYIDGLSGLFVVQVGHGRKELAEAAAKQAETLAFFPLWSYATPPAIELSERIAGYAPGDLNRVFFTTGGGEAVETRVEAGQEVLQADRQTR